MAVATVTVRLHGKHRGTFRLPDSEGRAVMRQHTMVLHHRWQRGAHPCQHRLSGAAVAPVLAAAFLVGTQRRRSTVMVRRADGASGPALKAAHSAPQCWLDLRAREGEGEGYVPDVAGALTTLFQGVRAELQRTGQALPQGRAVDAVLLDEGANAAAAVEVGHAMQMQVFTASRPGNGDEKGRPLVRLASTGQVVGTLEEKHGARPTVLLQASREKRRRSGLLANVLLPDAALWVAEICSGPGCQVGRE